jgi:hypothetical protein
VNRRCEDPRSIYNVAFSVYGQTLDSLL